MVTALTNQDESKGIDPNKDYYNLSLEQRFSEYQKWAWRRAYGQREKILKQLHENDKGDRLASKQLTAELKEIIPSFPGVVLRRDYNAWPSYVLSSENMQALFAESVFGRTTGKVVTKSDKLLSPHHQNLAGYIILIEEQDNLEKEGFIAAHEMYHASHTGYPSALRRDQYHNQLRNNHGLSPEETVGVMIGLDRAIQMDEAGAVLSSYEWLELRTWKLWIPGGNGVMYKVDLIKEWYHKFNIESELKNASRNLLGFKLSSARSSGSVGPKTVDAINQHERDSMMFPVRIKEATERIAQQSRNPENLEPLSYAISYVNEALQIVDYGEIMNGTLEPFCVDVLEPHRLGNWSGFGAAFSQALNEVLNGKPSKN